MKMMTEAEWKAREERIARNGGHGTKAFLKGETDPLNKSCQRWMVVDANGEFIGQFGCWKTRKSCLENFRDRNNGEFELQKEEIKIDHYAWFRRIPAKAGWRHPEEHEHLG